MRNNYAVSCISYTSSEIEVVGLLLWNTDIFTHIAKHLTPRTQISEADQFLTTSEREQRWGNGDVLAAVQGSPIIYTQIFQYNWYSKCTDMENFVPWCFSICVTYYLLNTIMNSAITARHILCYYFQSNKNSIILICYSINFAPSSTHKSRTFRNVGRPVLFLTGICPCSVLSVIASQLFAPSDRLSICGLQNFAASLKTWKSFGDEFTWYNHNQFLFFSYKITRYLNLFTDWPS